MSVRAGIRDPAVDFALSAGDAGRSGATLAFWSVADEEAMVDELTSKGVTFEQYAEPFKTDDKGIARFEGDAAGAWFRDPDGNVLALGSQQCRGERVRPRSRGGRSASPPRG